VTFLRSCFAHSGEACAVSGYVLLGAGEVPLTREPQTQISLFGSLLPGGVACCSHTLASLALSQRWRKTWAVLYPASPHGVARLEFFDHKGSSSGGGRGGSRRLDCKVIRLAECVSVSPVVVESPPEPGAAAFRLDTAQRSHLLAADAPSSAAWVQTLCRNAFPVRGRGWWREAGVSRLGLKDAWLGH
jgi:hypothetical protein